MGKEICFRGEREQESGRAEGIAEGLAEGCFLIGSKEKVEWKEPALPNKRGGKRGEGGGGKREEEWSRCNHPQMKREKRRQI